MLYMIAMSTTLNTPYVGLNLHVHEVKMIDSDDLVCSEVALSVMHDGKTLEYNVVNILIEKLRFRTNTYIDYMKRILDHMEDDMDLGKWPVMETIEHAARSVIDYVMDAVYTRNDVVNTDWYKRLIRQHG